MRNRLEKNWSEAELSRLRTMVRRKVDAKRIARMLGRRVGSVTKKVREVRLVPRKPLR
jgi:hypothetical protein